MTLINQTSIWAKLHQHQRATSHIHMKELFNQNPLRFKQMHEKLNGLLFDYSKNRITEDTLDLLIELAHTAELPAWSLKMKSGYKINISENRSVLHTALRMTKNDSLEIDGENVIPIIHQELNKALDFAESIRNGQYLGFSGEKITNIVNIGIGGSDLGPRMITTALKHYHHDEINIYYVSNLDASHIVETLKLVKPKNTLFIIASKSFTTPETLINAEVARNWFKEKNQTADIRPHFVAISSNKDKVCSFGIAESNIFQMFDWVGGRYSSWSSISLSVMCAIGKTRFLEFLKGGRTMDKHFFSTPYRHNIPVLLGLIGVWYNTFYRSSSHAIIPYSHELRRFPAYIQQLDMESNGKRTGRYGEYLDFDTGAVMWGEEGVNCQHAFFQLLHQGSRLICSDFIVIADNNYADKKEQHKILISNALAQARALMRGKTEMEAYQEIDHLPSMEKDLIAPQKYFPGNQPTNTIMFDHLTPFNLGMLLALYEHKVFVQGVVWGINSFDQWGVEYGKVLAKNIEKSIGNNEITNYDSSTNGLIHYFLDTQSNNS